MQFHKQISFVSSMCFSITVNVCLDADWAVLDPVEQMGHDIIFGYHASQTHPQIAWVCVTPCIYVWACAHPCKWAQVYVCARAHMPVFMQGCVLVYVSWLESRASLRWAAADILVCFNPLANKTAGNHQKNTSSWTGRRAWGGRGEERRGEEYTPVWINNKLKQGMEEREEEKGEGGLGTWM